MSFPNSLKRLAAAAVLTALAATLSAETTVGDRFPPIPVSDAGGAPLPSTQGKVVLVDFWASWCAPCKASFPAYARLYADYASRGLVILAVSVDDDPADYAAFIRRHRPPFPTFRDRDKVLVSAVAIPGMPTSFLIGRDGRVRYRHVGYYGARTEKMIRAEVAALLAEKP